jgi:hypothetical protein
LAKVHDRAGQFHCPEAAKAGGHDLVQGLHYCFNTFILDTTVGLLRLEAMVYTPSPNGFNRAPWNRLSLELRGMPRVTPIHRC